MTIWTDQKIDTIKAYIKEGYSAGKIAIEFGVGRNAIIGLCFRKNIKLNPVNSFEITQAISPIKNRGITMSFKCTPLPPEVRIRSKRIHLINRSQFECRYIIGDPKDQICCGNHAPTDHYCKAHHDLCYITLKPYVPREPAETPDVIKLHP